MSKLIPPEGSPRRLSGYPTYAFGYGNAFFIAFDSNIASDPIQLAWVADQLEHLDRARYHHVIAFFHHPPFSSGPHGGASAAPVPGTGQKAPDRLEPQTVAIRTMYMPLFRKHHVANARDRARSSLRSLGRALRGQRASTYRMDSARDRRRRRADLRATSASPICARIVAANARRACPRRASDEAWLDARREPAPFRRRPGRRRPPVARGDRHRSGCRIRRTTARRSRTIDPQRPRQLEVPHAR